MAIYCNILKCNTQYGIDPYCFTPNIHIVDMHKIAMQLLKLLQCFLLNQARAGHRRVHAWFLKIDPVRIVGMRVCVCVRARGY